MGQAGFEPAYAVSNYGILSAALEGPSGTTPRNSMNCLNCGRDTNNPRFCGRSCAASYNNKMFPKKQKTVVLPCCIDCGKQLTHPKSVRCNTCYHSGRMEDKTLGEVIYTVHHKSSAFALVRTRARAAIPKCPCQKCGYDKHTEVCHLKPIRDFELTALVSEINSPDNLIRLCPNCHWELDHGL